MATTDLFYRDEAGLSIYFRLWNSAGQVFDFNDNTFKAIGSATTPYVAATERTAVDGDGFSAYVATVNLANVNNTGTLRHVFWAAYSNGTPAAADVSVSDYAQMIVQFGRLGPVSIQCKCEAAMLTSAGNEVRILCWLEANGERISLASGSCTATFREHGSGSDLFAETDSAPNAAGSFELTKTSPGFTNDRIYQVTVAITDSAGNVFTNTVAMPVFG